jgi:hypothetical protein
MTFEPQSIGRLMEGGLAQLRGKGVACALFLIADAFATYTLYWAGARYAFPIEFSILAGVVASVLTSSVFILSLGNSLKAALADPVELFVRVLFAAVLSLVTTVAVIAGLILLIVPGLYLNARWFVSQPLVMLGGRGILASLRESWRLTGPSVWPLAGLTLILLVPDVAIGIFGGDPGMSDFTEPSLALVLEAAVTSAIYMFTLGIVVFAYAELSTRADRLAETFA